MVVEHDLRAVTMSQIAEDGDIGRVRLYKHFLDVESILLAWHDRRVAAHLKYRAFLCPHLARTPCEHLNAALKAYGRIRCDTAHEGHGGEMAALLHCTEHIAAL